MVDGARRKQDVQALAGQGRAHTWASLSAGPGRPNSRLLHDPLRKDLSLEGGQLKGPCQGPTIHPPTHELASTSPGL